MDAFLDGWSRAASTSVGLFWTALWAFAFGYLVSSLIQVLVTRERMRRAMGESGPASVATGTVFGFLSSSCSFAALSTTRALFAKGAGLVPSLAFLLASTNLVIELGIVIAIFLGWQFVVAEYVGGLLMIAIAWAFVSATRPRNLVRRVREKLSEDASDGVGDDVSWRERITSLAGWRLVATRYVMEWRMVWKDVLIGFTVAGAISAFVPAAFFESLFVGSGAADGGEPSFWEVVAQTLVGPVAAFFTFIGSMGNIPLAAILHENGVSFAGVMAFVFSDLVVLPVTRINARYYGWKFAGYVALTLLVCLTVAAIAVHELFSAFGELPESVARGSIESRDFFALDVGFGLDVVSLAASAALVALWWTGRESDGEGGGESGDPSLLGRITTSVCALAALWLVGGLVVPHLAAS
ncbi:MAG: permease [Planctomycetota bacterium]